MPIGDLVDYIILIGALVGAIYKIWDFFATPASKFKQRALNKERERINIILDEKLPDILYNHDLETRDKYKSDRQNYLCEIKDEVLRDIQGEIRANTEMIEALAIGTRDVLREKIMGIYHKNRHDHILTEYEREALDQYYKDYKALNGNSYIDKRYARMSKWKVVYEDDPDDIDEE